VRCERVHWKKKGENKTASEKVPASTTLSKPGKKSSRDPDQAGAKTRRNGGSPLGGKTASLWGSSPKAAWAENIAALEGTV